MRVSFLTINIKSLNKVNGTLRRIDKERFRYSCSRLMYNIHILSEVNAWLKYNIDVTGLCTGTAPAPQLQRYSNLHSPLMLLLLLFLYLSIIIKPLYERRKEFSCSIIARTFFSLHLCIICKKMHLIILVFSCKMISNGTFKF